MVGISRRSALLSIVAMPALLTRAAAQDGVIGEVVSLRGTISANRPPDQVRLLQGSVILRQDRIVTAADGRIKVRFVDGTVISLGENSELVAAQYDVDAGGVRRAGVLSVISGLFRATVAPGAPGSRFEVQTSTAVASVRSTDWMAEATPENTGVFVFEGAVAVSARQPVPNGTVVLRPGEGTDVRAPAPQPGTSPTRGLIVAMPPTAPAPWGAARIAALRARTEL